MAQHKLNQIKPDVKIFGKIVALLLYVFEER